MREKANIFFVKLSMLFFQDVNHDLHTHFQQKNTNKMCIDVLNSDAKQCKILLKLHTEEIYESAPNVDICLEIIYFLLRCKLFS